MDLEKEIELLKEKVALLEKVKELQDNNSAHPRIPYPYIPAVPTRHFGPCPCPDYPPWLWPTATYTSGTWTENKKG
jgi:hypothetical protein